MSDQTPNDNSTPPNRPESIKDVFNIAMGTVQGVGDGLRNEKTQEALGDIKKEVTGVLKPYKREIVIVLISLLFLRIYKRRVSRKAVKKALKTLEAAGKVNSSNLQSILEELRAYPGQAVMDPSNGMVHLLKGKDAIVTVFGDFDRMETEELWNQVANILNLGVKVDPRIAR